MKSFFAAQLSRWLGGVAAVSVAALVMTGGAWAQTNPTAQSLPYSQAWGTATFTTMPAGTAAWNGLDGGSITAQALAEASAPTGNATVTAQTASTTTGGSFGLANASNARYYVQTSSNATNGVNQLGAAINTTGLTNISVSYAVEMINASPRTAGVVMQYRVGHAGAWTTVGGTGNPFSQAGGTTGVKATPSLTLPAAAENQAEVQLRWATWRGTEAGNSSGLAIDNIAVTGTAGPPAAPTATAATGITSSGFTANWGSVGGATSYRLDIATDAGFSSLVSGYNDLTVAGTSQAVTGLSASIAYFYRVRAVNGSGTSGNSNTITATTAGSLASEPTVAASSLSFNSVTATSMGLSWSNGDGATRIVVGKAGSAVAGTPSDGSTYSANSVFGSGGTIAANEFVVFNAAGNSVTVTGLSPNTTYHFVVFELNGSGGTENYLVTTPATGNQTTTFATYTWNASGTASWTTAANWTPTRTTPQSSDVLQFNAGGTVTVTSVPTQTVAQLLVSGASTVNLEAGAASAVLTVGGGSGTDLSVDATSALSIDGANSLKLLVATGATGSISGAMTYTNAAHTLDAADASGVTFQSGAAFIQGTGATGSVFTTAGTANVIVFASGSSFSQQAGSNPFGLGQPASKVVFQAGSLYRHLQTATPSLSGRTYANFELNSAVANISGSGVNALSIDDLTIAQGTLHLGMTGTFNLKGNVSVANAATLDFNAASASTITFSGTSPQTVSGTGTLTVGANENFSVTNAPGVDLQRSVTMAGDVSVTGGELDVTAGTLTLRDMTVTSSGILRVQSGGALTVGRNLFDNATYTGSGTLTFTGTGAWTNPAGNMTFGSVVVASGASITAGSNLNVGALALSGPFDPSTFAISVSGNTDLNAGGSLNMGAAATHRTGSLRSFGGTVPGSVGTVVLTGNVGQLGGSSPLSLARLTIDGSAVGSLAGDVSVTGLFTLGGGNVLTGANTLTIVSPATVTRTNGHVVGNLKMPIASGPGTQTWEIGDVNHYTPVTITGTGAGFTSAFDAVGSTTSGDRPGLAASGIDPTHSVNRFHTITATGYTGGTYDITLNFEATDVDVAAAGNTASFIVRKNTGGTWTATTNGTRTATSTQATGLTGFSDFSIGEQGIDHYVVAASSPQNQGATFATSVSAEDALNFPVSTDNTTAVTMTSSGAATFDQNGDATFGDNVKTLTAGTFNIDTKDNTAETVTLTATDGNGKTGDRTGLVIQAPLSITTTSLPNATAGAAYSQTVAAANGTAPYTWSIDSGSLPGGMVLESATGEIHGTATLAGTSNFVVKVTDALSATATQALAITVDAGAAAQLVATQQPGNGAAAAIITPHFTVRLRDANGNNVTTSGVPVGVGLTAGTGTVLGTTSRNTDGTGSVAFDDLIINAAGTGKQLTASSGILTPAVSSSFDLAAGAPTTLSFDVQPSTATSAVAITPAVKVKVADALGNGVPAELVSLSLVGDGTLSGYAPTNTDANGIATFSTLSVDLGGTKHLEATTSSLGPVSSADFDITAGPAAQLGFASVLSTTVAGVPISPAVQVDVSDASGNPVANQSVTLSLVGTGTLSGYAPTLTDANGLATFPPMSIDLVGTKQLSASAAAAGPTLSPTFTIQPNVPAIVAYVVQPTNTVAGQLMTPAVKVKVTDAYLNPLENESVFLNVVGGGTNSGSGHQTAADGVATFTDISIDLAGTKTLETQVGATTPVSSDPFDITPAAAFSLTFDQEPTNIVAGQPFTPAIAVSVRDQFTNVVPSSTAPITLQMLNGTGSLVGTTIVNAVAGVATFTGLTMHVTGNAKSLEATSPGLGTGGSQGFDVAAAAPSSLSFDVQPSGAATGAAITPAVKARVTDAFLNPIAAELVSLSLVGSGTLSGYAPTATDPNGIATFSTLSVDLTGTKHLDATTSALGPVSSTDFVISAGAAANLTFDVQPSGATAGASISPAVKVKVTDSIGNPIPTELVSLSLVGSGTLSGYAPTTTDANGIATFSTLSVDLVGTKHLDATTSSLGPVSSNNFVISTGAAANLTFDVQPSGAVAGASITPAVKVKVTDTLGNPIPTELVSLNLVGSGTLSGYAPTATDANGIATFSTLSVDLIGTKHLDATTSSLGPVSSTNFVISAGAAANLTFDVQPSGAASGVAITPAVKAKVTDALGNGVPTELVSLSLVGSGTLSGYAPTATDANGIATFSTLNVDLVGTKHLDATTSALGPVSSTNFVIGAGAPANLTFDVQPSNALVNATITPAVKAKVTDGSGNSVASELVSLTLVGSGTLGGYAPTNTDANGIATFSTLSVNFSGNGKQLSATTGSLGPVLSATFDITCPAIAVGPASLPAGTAGTPYSQTVSGSGGVSPYTYAITAGSLPGGLGLNINTGEISGTPGAAGPFNVTVTATDAAGCTGSQAYSLTISVACPSISVLPAVLPAGSINVAYTPTLSASAGTSPFVFAVTSGSLPTGVSLSTGGVFSGTPTAVGTFPFTVGVTDANGCTGSRAYSVTILAIPAAVTNLVSQQVVSGNDTDGNTKITLTWTMPSGAATAQVYRAGFGHYPEYDDAGGIVPATPSYPPGSPWVLTAVTATGQTDEPGTRDFYYYVVFVKNAAGGVSAVSNKTLGSLDYHLGDVSDGVTVGVGNNGVGDEDISLLGSNYGISEPDITTRGVGYLDVGPTTNLALTSRPFTDDRIDFEDLILFATNYHVVSKQQAVASATGAAPSGPEEFQVVAPSLVEAGSTVTAVLKLKAGGRIQGFSAQLAWDATVVTPLGMTSAQWVEGQGGLVLAPSPGTVDAALLGVSGTGMTGEGEVARVTFRVLRAGDAQIKLAKVVARDGANKDLGSGELVARAEALRPTRTVLLAPWPNPFQGSAGVEFSLAEAGAVELAVYGVDGRRVRTLVKEAREAGVYREAWDGRDDARHLVGSGVFYIHFVAGGRRFSKTIVYLR